MHLEILSKEQQEILPLFLPFKTKYYMVGGTSIALYLGHRKSIDFDFFTLGVLNKTKIRTELSKLPFKVQLIHELEDQMHYLVNSVKITFFSFPYPIPVYKNSAFPYKIPDLLTLSAMKAFALGGRGKWKDYVDLFFILNSGIKLKEIQQKAIELFPTQFNPTLFLKQLVYFDDINYAESVEFLPGFEITNSEIETGLRELVLI